MFACGFVVRRGRGAGLVPRRTALVKVQRSFRNKASVHQRLQWKLKNKIPLFWPRFAHCTTWCRSVLSWSRKIVSQTGYAVWWIVSLLSRRAAMEFACQVDSFLSRANPTSRCPSMSWRGNTRGWETHVPDVSIVCDHLRTVVLDDLTLCLLWIPYAASSNSLNGAAALCQPCSASKASERAGLLSRPSSFRCRVFLCYLCDVQCASGRALGQPNPEDGESTSTVVAQTHIHLPSRSKHQVHVKSVFLH